MRYTSPESYGPRLLKLNFSNPPWTPRRIFERLARYVGPRARYHSTDTLSRFFIDALLLRIFHFIDENRYTFGQCRVSTGGA